MRERDRAGEDRVVVRQVRLRIVAAVLVLDVHAHPDLLEIEAISVDSDRVSDAPRPVWRRSAALSYWTASQRVPRLRRARLSARADFVGAIASLPRAGTNDWEGQSRRRASALSSGAKSRPTMHRPNR